MEIVYIGQIGEELANTYALRPVVSINLEKSGYSPERNLNTEDEAEYIITKQNNEKREKWL